MWGLSSVYPSLHWVRLSSIWGPRPSPGSLTLSPGRSRPRSVLPRAKIRAHLPGCSAFEGEGRCAALWAPRRQVGPRQRPSGLLVQQSRARLSPPTPESQKRTPGSGKESDLREGHTASLSSHRMGAQASTHPVTGTPGTVGGPPEASPQLRPRAWTTPASPWAPTDSWRAVRPACPRLWALGAGTASACWPCRWAAAPARRCQAAR